MSKLYLMFAVLFSVNSLLAASWSRDGTSNGECIVRSHDAGGAMLRGSGQLIDPSGIVLTCAHGINGRETVIFPESEDTRTFRATVIAVDRVHDVSLLRIPRPKLGRFRPLAAITPRAGTPLVSFGFSSYRGRRGLLDGTVWSGGRTVRWGAPSIPGDSGGPVMNSRGEVVSVIWGSADGYSYGIAPDRLRAFCQKHGITARPAIPREIGQP